MFNSTFRPSWSKWNKIVLIIWVILKSKLSTIEKESKAEALHGDDAWIPNRDWFSAGHVWENVEWWSYAIGENTGNIIFDPYTMQVNKNNNNNNNWWL